MVEYKAIVKSMEILEGGRGKWGVGKGARKRREEQIVAMVFPVCPGGVDTVYFGIELGSLPGRAIIV